MAGVALLHFLAGRVAAGALDGSAGGRSAALFLLLLALLPVLLLDSTFAGRGREHFRHLGHLPIAPLSYGVAAWWNSYCEFWPALGAFLLPLLWASPPDRLALLLSVPLFSLLLISAIALLQQGVVFLAGGTHRGGGRRGVLQALIVGLYVGGVVWIRGERGAWTAPAWSLSPWLPPHWFGVLDPRPGLAGGPPALQRLLFAAASGGALLLVSAAAIAVRSHEFRLLAPPRSGIRRGVSGAPPGRIGRVRPALQRWARAVAGPAATLTWAHLWRDSRGLGRALGLVLASLLVMGVGIQRGELTDLFQPGAGLAFSWRISIYAYCVIAYWAIQDFALHSSHARAAWLLLSASGDPTRPGRQVRRAIRAYLLIPYATLVALMLAGGAGNALHAALESGLIFVALEGLATALRALRPRHPFSLPHDRSVHAVGRQLLLTALGTSLLAAVGSIARYSIRRGVVVLAGLLLLYLLLDRFARRRARRTLLYADLSTGR